MADQTKPEGAGIQLKPAHFPGRAPVDTYGNGGFRFADMSHKGSILCLPSGIYGWSVGEASELTAATLKRVLAEPDLEIVLIGTGDNLIPLKPALREAFSNNGMRAEVMSTGAAARTFNVLLAEGRSVGAALIAVD